MAGGEADASGVEVGARWWHVSATARTRPAALLRALMSDPATAVSLVFLCLVVLSAVFAPFAAPHSPDKQDYLQILSGTVVGASVRHRPARPRPALADHLRRTDVARHRRLRGGDRPRLGDARRDDRRLHGRLARQRVDARRRPDPGLPAADLRDPDGDRPRAQPRERDPGGRRRRSSRCSRGCPARSTLAERSKEYVEAAVAAGAGHWRILRQDIWPNVMPAIYVQGASTIGVAILSGAALSFLGIGVQPPTADWGRMVAEFAPSVYTDPWLAFYPGLAIGLTALASNLVGDGILRFVDPGEDRAHISMLWFFVRRLLQLIGLLIVVSAVIFFVLRLGPFKPDAFLEDAGTDPAGSRRSRASGSSTSRCRCSTSPTFVTSSSRATSAGRSPTTSRSRRRSPRGCRRRSSSRSSRWSSGRSSASPSARSRR